MSVKSWTVVKEVTKGDQIVAVVKSRVEIQSASVPRFQFVETGWVVTQRLRVEGKCGGLDQAPSVMRVCVRSTPERDGAALPRDELAEDSATAKVIAEYHLNRCSLVQIIDNKVVDECLASSGGRECFESCHVNGTEVASPSPSFTVTL